MDLGLGEGGGYVEKAKGYLDVVKGDMKASEAVQSAGW